MAIFVTNPSCEVARVHCQRADASASPMWGDDDAPPRTRLWPPSHELTPVRGPAGQGREAPARQEGPRSLPSPAACVLHTARACAPGSGDAPKAEDAGWRATTTDRPAALPPHPLPDGGEWRGPAGPGQDQARHITPPSKSGSPAGAYGRVLSSSARWHVSAVARCCCQSAR